MDDKYTGDDKKTKAPLTFWLLVTTLVTTCCSSLQYGYQVGVLTGPSKLIQKFYNESNEARRDVYLSDTALLWLWSITVSIYCIGGAIGAMVSGHLADVLGRKGALLLINVFSILGGLLMGLSYVANNYEMVIIGRFVIGFYVGIVISLVPLYLAEISPVSLRGAIVTTHQLLVTIGLLLAQYLGLFVLNDETEWPILLALTSAPSVIQLIILPFCSESPRWLLIMRDNEEKCRHELQKLRATDNVNDEIDELRRAAEENKTAEKVGVFSVLRLQNPDWRMPLIICVCLHVGQQFSGINAIMYYATDIYYESGMDETQVAYSTVGIGLITVLVTVGAVYAVEKAGRRPLLVYPFAVTTICTALLTMSLSLQENADGWKWFSLLFIYVYIIVFAIGPGSIPFVIVPELWAQGPRPAAMSISVQVNWYCNFLVGITFPLMQETIGAYAFLVFSFFCLLITLFAYFYVPETKGRSFEDIVTDFKSKQDVEKKNAVYVNGGFVS